MPSLRNTSSKAALNLLSRSWIRNRVRSRTPVKLSLARLLCDPGAGRVGCAAGEVDGSASELDEEQHVVAAQRDRLDREEIACPHARRLLAQELAPAWPAAPRRGRQAGGQQEPPDGARRDAHAELDQLTCCRWSTAS
jgi:hypothetical protein